MKPKIIAISLITPAAGYLRFNNLGAAPLWVDQAGFGFLVQKGGYQEFIPQWFALLFQIHGELGLRSPQAMCGTLTAPLFHSCAKKDLLNRGSVVVSRFVHGKLITQER